MPQGRRNRVAVETQDPTVPGVAQSANPGPEDVAPSGQAWEHTRANS